MVLFEILIIYNSFCLPMIMNYLCTVLLCMIYSVNYVAYCKINTKTCISSLYKPCKKYGMLSHNVVTTFKKPNIITLYTTLWECCINVVHNVVGMLWQRCHNIVGMLCHNVVTTLKKPNIITLYTTLCTTLWQRWW